MKSFKQFLYEKLEDDIELVKPPVPKPEKQSLPPSRNNYSDDEEGTRQWKADVNSWVPGAKKEAQQMTTNAESSANTLGKIETGLKTAEAVTDTALSAGAVAVPGVGTALNAAVKGVKGGINASQGNYLAAGLNVADAALPIAGQLKTAGKIATTVGSLIKSPVSSALEKGAEALGVTKTLAGEAVKAIPTATEVLSNTGAQFGRNVAAKAGVKIASKTLENPIKSTTSDIIGSMSSDTDTSKSSRGSSTLSASSSNFRGKTNIPKA